MLLLQVNIEALQASHAKEVAELTSQVIHPLFLMHAQTINIDQTQNRETVDRGLHFNKGLHTCQSSFMSWSIHNMPRTSTRNEVCTSAITLQ